MKKFLTFLTLLMVSVLVLAACAAPDAEEPAAVEKEEPAAEVVELNWVQWWDPEYGEDVLDELLDRFSAAHPGIKVNRTSVPWDSMYDSMITSAQADEAKYDVFGMEACCWVSQLVKLGALEPLDSYLEADADFAAGITGMSPTKWLGETYMLNWYNMPYAYTYNMEAFAEAGLEPPTNWDEFKDVTRALNESDVVEFGAAGMFGHAIYTPYYTFGVRLAQLGGKFYDENSCAVFNSAEGVQSMNDWKELYDDGTLAPGSMSFDENDLIDFLTAGRVAAMWNGPWVGSKVRLANPDITMAYAPAWVDKETGSGGHMWAGSGNAIASNSAHKDEAWTFMKFLLSDENTLWMADQVSVSFASNAAFASFATGGDPILEQVPAMMNNDPENNLFLDPTVNFSVHDEFVTAFQDVMAGDRDAQGALDELVSLWNEELPDCN